MIIVAFSEKTSKILPRVFCGKIKHVAPVIPRKKTLVLYQFVRPGHIEKISLKWRDIKILMKHGWKFIYISGAVAHDINANQIWTCVQLTKKIIGIDNWRIQTPGGLYRFLCSQ